MGSFQNLLQVVQHCDKVTYPFVADSAEKCPVPFVFCDAKGAEHVVGFIQPWFAPTLQTVNDSLPAEDRALVFEHVENTTNGVPHIAKVKVSPHLQDYTERNACLLRLAHALRTQGGLPGLQGWRNEALPVFGNPTRLDNVAFTLERVTTSIFGVPLYGINVNGYCVTAQGELKMWVARRSLKKPTWPGALDNVVGGLISHGDGILQTVIKECFEEANLPESVSRTAVPVGAVSFFGVTENGLKPAVDFIHDLVLPEDAPLIPNDGEVDSFQLFSMDELKRRILGGEFKPDSAMIIIDFLVRHGVITPENEPVYLAILACGHRRLPFPCPTFPK
ncbi:hypothetical protein IWQ61_009098 [Dispira simplex]|nr:hypothetical protein IWQ61_009098 [Dispira simplex]